MNIMRNLRSLASATALTFLAVVATATMTERPAWAQTDPAAWAGVNPTAKSFKAMAAAKCTGTKCDADSVDMVNMLFGRASSAAKTASVDATAALGFPAGTVFTAKTGGGGGGRVVVVDPPVDTTDKKSWCQANEACTLFKQTLKAAHCDGTVCDADRVDDVNSTFGNAVTAAKAAENKPKKVLGFAAGTVFTAKTGGGSGNGGGDSAPSFMDKIYGFFTGHGLPWWSFWVIVAVLVVLGWRNRAAISRFGGNLKSRFNTFMVARYGGPELVQLRAANARLTGENTRFETNYRAAIAMLAKQADDDPAELPETARELNTNIDAVIAAAKAGVRS